MKRTLVSLAVASLFASEAAQAQAARARSSEVPASPWLQLAPAVSAGELAAPMLGGFFAHTLAYTNAKPRHWSRAVSRLQLEATGTLGAGLKWKASGRLDVDPVYYGSNFYRQDVKRDQRLNAFWRETYLDWSAGGWDFRFGAQNIVWGEVVGLFFADVVSARDQREFILPAFDIIRIPQWAARAEYAFGDSRLDLVWIPIPTFDEFGKPGSDFYPIRLSSPTSDSEAAAYRDPQKPARSLRNSNYGARASTLVGGFDLAAFHYRGYSTQPTFYRSPVTGPVPFVFTPRYDRIAQTGATFSKDLESFVLKGEGVYTRGQGYLSSDPGIANAVSERSSFDYILSAEWTVDRTRLNLQGFQRIVSGGERDLALKTAGFGASVLVAHKLSERWEPQILWIENFADAGRLIRPRLNWTPIRNVAIAFGADIFAGPTNGFFGRFGNRDRLYTELRYSF
jgi:hypothetical protein